MLTSWSLLGDNYITVGPSPFGRVNVPLTGPQLVPTKEFKGHVCPWKSCGFPPLQCQPQYCGVVRRPSLEPSKIWTSENGLKSQVAMNSISVILCSFLFCFPISTFLSFSAFSLYLPSENTFKGTQKFDGYFPGSGLYWNKSLDSN